MKYIGIDAYQQGKSEKIDRDLYPGEFRITLQTLPSPKAPWAVTSSIIRQPWHTPSAGSPHRSQEENKSARETLAPARFFQAQECVFCCRVTNGELIQHRLHVLLKWLVIIRTSGLIIPFDMKVCIECHFFFWEQR